MANEDSVAEDKWYLLHDERRLGPYSFEMLVEAANNNTIQDTDLIRCQGRSGWIAARMVPGLFSPPVAMETVHQFLATMFPAPDRVEIARQSAWYRAIRGRKLIWASLATAVVVMIGGLSVPTEFGKTLLRIVTEYTTGAYDSVKGGRSPGKLAQTLDSIPAYAILERVDPREHDRILQELSRRYADGATEDQILSGARNILFKTLQPYLVRASDAAVLENIDIIISYMDGLRDVDAESCVSLVDEPKGAKLTANLTKQFPGPFKRELALHAEILNANGQSNPNAAATTAQQAGPYLVKVFNTIAARRGLKLDLLARDKLAPSEYQDYCQVTLALFREIRQLPRHEALQVLRYLYSLGNR